MSDDERLVLRERAQQRAQLYDDLLALQFSDEAAAYLADKLWEKGWRNQANLVAAERAVRRGMSQLEASVIDPVEEGEGYECPECHTTDPQTHQMGCSLGGANG